MPTRNVVLTEHQHELVEALVRSGEYQNASEVLRDGLRLLEREHAVQAARLAALRAAADLGWTDVGQGAFAEVDDDSLEGFVARLGTHPPAPG